MEGRIVEPERVYYETEGSTALRAAPRRINPLVPPPLPHVVQLDLHAAGLIADPFRGTTVDDATLRWVHEPRQN
jgi:hypothetical protein